MGRPSGRTRYYSKAMKDRPILKNKFYLYLTEFFAGMSLMAVELGASRLLAPYFSSSQIVWTIIIGTIMIAMALGNLYGGRSADRDPDPDKLYMRILVAAVWIAAIPLLGKYIIIAISGLLIVAIDTNFLIIAAFLACMVIFVYPLFLLGTVTPSLVKYTMDSMDDSASTVGRLGACNTVGSILGTFLPTFVTIPAVGTAVSFLLFSGILLVLAVIYFVSAKTGKKAVAIALVLFLVSSIFGHSGSFAFWEKDLSYEGESIYNYLQVADRSDRIILSTNVLFGVQSVKMKEPGLTGMYYDYALAAPIMAGIPEKGLAEFTGRDPGRVLVLGNGTGTYATLCAEYFETSEIEGVEIDEKISDLAYEYFDMSQDVRLTTYDGRAYLQAVDGRYDVILVDAYQDITIPFQMSSLEFFGLVKDHLTDNGVMVVNMNMHSDGEGSINEALSDTIAAVFPYVYTVDVRNNTNRELFAANFDVSQALTENNVIRDISQVSAMGSIVGDSLTAYDAGNNILTDDRAPVEVLGMRAIDELISSELGYYKDLFKEEGIKGVLELL